MPEVLVIEDEVAGVAPLAAERLAGPRGLTPDEGTLLASLSALGAEELAAANAELEQASRAMAGFLATFGHELRTRLHVVLGFAEVLLDRRYGRLTPKQADFLGEIQASGRHLLSLFEGIPDLTRGKATEHAGAPEVVALALGLTRPLVSLRGGALRAGRTGGNGSTLAIPLSAAAPAQAGPPAAEAAQAGPPAAPEM
jgi:signal transduction histidine kinase